jgi:3-methyladenine DNA glycosylase/8-oxoguanine DNA glycosylase
LRVAGCWSGFELAARAILDQGLGAAAAGALAGRIVQSYGEPFPIAAGVTHLFPTPEVLADADLDSAGLPLDRALAVRTLAQAVCEERISFDKVADPDAVVAQLSMMPGFSESSVQYVAMRALREPDAFPFGAGTLAAELEQRSRAWRPWRAYAAAYLSEPGGAR